MQVDDLRKNLAEYIAGRMDYPTFRELTVEIYSELASRGDSLGLDICRAIEWNVADYSEGHISEDQLKSRLADLWNGRGSWNLQPTVSSYILWQAEA